jgi:hypothetical protein
VAEDDFSAAAEYTREQDDERAFAEARLAAEAANAKAKQVNGKHAVTESDAGPTQSQKSPSGRGSKHVYISAVSNAMFLCILDWYIEVLLIGHFERSKHAQNALIKTHEGLK